MSGGDKGGWKWVVLIVGLVCVECRCDEKHGRLRFVLYIMGWWGCMHSWRFLHGGVACMCGLRITRIWVDISIEMFEFGPGCGKFFSL
jgi:hypothetical protein